MAAESKKTTALLALLYQRPISIATKQDAIAVSMYLSCIAAGLPTASNKSLKIPPPRPVSIATEITPTRSKRL